MLRSHYYLPPVTQCNPPSGLLRLGIGVQPFSHLTIPCLACHSVCPCPLKLHTRLPGHTLNGRDTLTAIKCALPPVVGQRYGLANYFNHVVQLGFKASYHSVIVGYTLSIRLLRVFKPQAGSSGIDKQPIADLACTP